MHDKLRTHLVQFGLGGGPWLRRFARQSWPSHWRVSGWLGRRRFWLHLRILDVRRDAENSRRTLRVARDLGSVVFVPVLRAVVLVVALGTLERVFSPLLSGTPLRGLDLVEWLRAHRPDPAAYPSLLGTVVQIAAVFLGLYYTAVSVIVSSSYRDVPGGVRRRILSEHAGTFYQDTVAFAGATALVMNAGVVMGWDPGWINFGVLVLLSVASMFAFVVLGVRLFEFFDPATLARTLTHDIFEKARSATPRGYRWGEVSFQDWYRRQAAEDLKVLRHVVSLAGAEELRAGESLKIVADHILRLFSSYTQITPDIPVESHWFQRMPQHPSWLTADHTRLSMAIRTETGLGAKLVPDHLWVESELLAGIRDTLHALLHRREYEGVAQVASRAKNLVLLLAARFQMTQAVRLHRVLATLAAEEMRRADGVTLESRADYSRAGAIELLSMGPVQLVLGVLQAVEGLTPHSIRQFAAASAVEYPDAPIRRPVPEVVREELGKLRAAIDFERAAEGRRVTPTWFLAHHLGRSYTTYLVQVLPSLVDEAESTYLEPARALWREAPATIVVLAAQRGLEACNKLQVHLERMASRHQDLLVLQHSVDTNDAWPVLELEPILLRVASLREELLALLARLATRLRGDVPTGESPDDLGYAYTALTEASFEALVEGRWTLFERIFPSTVHLAFQAHDRLLSETKDFSTEYRISAPVNILADPIELSGYALLLAELEGGSAWSTAKRVWDQILGGHDDPAALINLLMVRWKIARSSSSWVMHPRAMQRMAWDQVVENRLQNLGLLDERRGYYRRGMAKAAPASPLVRAFLHTHGYRSSAGDLFLAEYLLARPEAQGVEIPDSVRAVIKELERARSSGESDLEEP